MVSKSIELVVECRSLTLLIFKRTRGFLFDPFAWVKLLSHGC
jgi:hypothetical protein